MELEQIEVQVGLPWGMGSVAGTWKPDDAQRQASWEMYIELITRATVVELGPDEGLLREALGSLYSLFDITRELLRKYGPAVAVASSPDSRVTFGHLAVSILNGALRPFLAKWHPALAGWESQCPESRSSLHWEREWSESEALRADLAEVTRTLRSYAGVLGEACGAKSLLVAAGGVAG